MYRIFIAEDDATIAEQIKKHLEGWDYEVKCAEDTDRILEEFSEFSPQLVLLDIALPRHNGFYWCGKIREMSDVPIIFISSASDNMSVVTAVSMGGDDFISKPFDLAVLTAKIRAMLRRAYDMSGGDVISYAGITLDISRAEADFGGKKAQLTKNELLILALLMKNHGRIVSRETLMQRLWETDSFVDENTLSVNVARLRRKLCSIGAGELIETRIKMGYIIK